MLQIQYLYDDINAILNEYRQINERINPYKQFGMYSWENEANSKRLFHMFVAGSGSEKRRNVTCYYTFNYITHETIVYWHHVKMSEAALHSRSSAKP